MPDKNHDRRGPGEHELRPTEDARAPETNDEVESDDEVMNLDQLEAEFAQWAASARDGAEDEDRDVDAELAEDDEEFEEDDEFDEEGDEEGLVEDEGEDEEEEEEEEEERKADQEETDEEEEHEEEEAGLDTILRRLEAGKPGEIEMRRDGELEEELEEGRRTVVTEEELRPRGVDEFLCMSCFLVKHRRQLADPKRSICRDCANS